MKLPRLGSLAAFGSPGRITSVEQTTLPYVRSSWLGPGVADWYHHRKSDIGTTSEAHQSAVHVRLLAEAGVAAMLSLFLPINDGALLAAISALANTVPSSANAGPRDT